MVGFWSQTLSLHPRCQVPPYGRYCLWGVCWTLLSIVHLGRWVGYHLTGVIACGVFAGRCCPGCALEDGLGTTSQALLPVGCSLDVVVQRAPRKMGQVPPLLHILHVFEVEMLSLLQDWARLLKTIQASHHLTYMVEADNVPRRLWNLIRRRQQHCQRKVNWLVMDSLSLRLEKNFCHQRSTLYLLSGNLNMSYQCSWK